MAGFPASPYLYVDRDSVTYRVFRADGEVQFLTKDDNGSSWWLRIGLDVATEIRTLAGWRLEEDGWRPSWWFGNRQETSHG